MIKTISWIAALTGIVGQILVAINYGDFLVFIGFVSFVISSGGWTYVAIQTNQSALLAMSAAFLITDVIGVVRWY
jgi:hypothetical protein